MSDTIAALAIAVALGIGIFAIDSGKLFTVSTMEELEQ